MDAESFHRLEKVFIDSEEAQTLDEAAAMFSEYGVRIVLGATFWTNADEQIVALTAINIACRTFRGNVVVLYERNARLCVPGFVGVRIDEALAYFGARADVEAAPPWPTIQIGFDSTEKYGDNFIRPWACGWAYGLGRRVQSQPTFPPACVAAGALAINEAFSIMRQDNPYAGRRSIVRSLWSIDSCSIEVGPDATPEIPSCLLVGLGHLGQAYAWILGFMVQQKNATICLQDEDRVTRSTLSTSVLSFEQDLTERKTRVVSRWLEARGFDTAVIERRFSKRDQFAVGDPRFALFGVDNTAARRLLDSTGFELAVDAGLGGGHMDFRAIGVRTFPGPSKAAEIWADSGPTASPNMAPAYDSLLRSGAEPCGVATLATRSVGASFVGCIAAAYAVAELARHLLDGPKYGYVDLNLRDPEAIEAA